MAGEVSRKMSVRRITSPNDDSVYVDLKIIDKIRFVEPESKYQEWELSYENNLNAGRQVHVVEVGEDNLQVERIDFLRKVNQGQSQYQEWENEYSNLADPPVHYKTHKKKIYALEADGVTKNESVWIEVQRIDEIIFKDPKEHYQERVWKLVWPDLTNSEWDYQDLTAPVTDWDGTSINPPWRLDPYQTIVDCSFSNNYILLLHSTNKISYAPMSKLSNPVGYTTTRTLPTSSWSGQAWGCISQFKFASNIHIACAPVCFNADGTIAAPTDYYGLYYYNVKNSILGAGVYEAPNDAFNYYYEAYSPIPMNGTATALYTVYGNTYSFVDGVPVLQSTGADFVYSYNIAAISATGQWWSCLIVDMSGGGGVQLNGLFDSYYSDAQFSAYNTQTSLAGEMMWSSYGGGTASASDNRFYRAFPDGGGLLDYSFSDTTTMRIATYSNNGSVDTVEVKTIDVSYSSSSNNFTGVYNNEISFAGVSSIESSDGVSSTASGLYTPNVMIGYHMGNTSDSMFITAYEMGTALGASITPFDGQTSATSVSPYMFVANGKHYLSAYSLNDIYAGTQDMRFVVDGVNVSSAYKSALGLTDLFDVQYILLDVKKSDIDQLT